MNARKTKALQMLSLKFKPATPAELEALALKELGFQIKVDVTKDGCWIPKEVVNN